MRAIAILVASFTVLVVAGCGGGDSASVVETQRVLEFAPDRTLIVRGGDVARDDLPVTVVLRTHDHDDLEGFAKQLATLGAVVFDAPWRSVEDGGRYPDVFMDVSCAIGFARAHAADFGGDGRTVTLVSHSAGSYVAALAAFRTYDGPCNAPPGLPDLFVGIAGIYGLALNRNGLAVPEQQDATIAAYLGGPVEQHPAAYADIQLVNQLGDHPALEVVLIHGASDTIVPAAQSVQWHRRFTEADYAATLHVVEGADHTSLLVDGDDAGTVAAWILDGAR